MLSRVFYESKITGRFGPLSVLALQKKCTKRNIEQGITSFLYFDQSRIFQVLEGNRDVLDAAMNRIAANKLHHDLKIRAIMKSPDRRFKHWAFGGTNSEDPDFKRAMNACQLTDFFSFDVLMAERMLGIIASRKRRALKTDEFAMQVRNFSGRKSPPKGLFSARGTETGLMAGQVHVPREDTAQPAPG